jgi:hypothetical protein
MTTKDPRRLRHWRHRSTWHEWSARYFDAAVPGLRYAGRRYRCHWPGHKGVVGQVSLAKGQRLQSALAPFRPKPRAGVNVSGVQENSFRLA